jgi:hypothetical protein
MGTRDETEIENYFSAERLPETSIMHYAFHYCIFSIGGFQSWPLLVNYLLHYFSHYHKNGAKIRLMVIIMGLIIDKNKGTLKDPIDCHSS